MKTTLEIRDMFALAALPECIRNTWGTCTEAREIAAGAAYRYADAMIEARDTPQHTKGGLKQ